MTACDLMYTELLRFKQRTGKPVIASMLDVGASGAYYIACAADRIYAHPTTVTGSIGVIVEYANFEELFDKIGLKGVVLKSGKYKDIMSPIRDMTEDEKNYCRE